MKLTDLFEGKMKVQSYKDAADHYERMKKLKDAGKGNLSDAGLENLRQAMLDALDREIEKGETALKTKHSDEWFHLATQMYPVTKVDGGYRVTSKVKDWTGEKRLDGTGSPWEFTDESEARYKVLQLVKWLEANRKRNIGDADSDIAKWQKKLDAADLWLAKNDPAK